MATKTAGREYRKGRSILTRRDVERIAEVYDGQTGTIDALVRRYRVPRYSIIRAAKAGGYRSKRNRKIWTPADDDYLRQNWGRLHAEEIADHLGCSVCACTLRKKRLGISTRNFEDLSIRDLEELTRIDHRQWHGFIERKWLRAWQQPRRCDAPPVTRVPIDELHAFLRAHPDVFDYAGANSYVRGVLELNTLPTAPRFKRLTCRSEVWTDGMRDTPVGPKVHHGDVQVRPLRHSYGMASCGASGGTSFWAPTYEVSPSCPRCGCKVSRFSEGIYSDEDPGQGETIALLAAKLGLAWKDGALVDSDGQQVKDDALLKYVFSTRRQAGKAFRVFSRLLENGLSVCPTHPISEERLLPDITGIRLRDNQKQAFELLRATGHIGDYSPPSMGKSTFGVYVLTRLAGRHVVFVPTEVLREQWVKALRRMTPGARVRRVWKPSHTEVAVLDHDGAVRCVVDIYNYRTAHEFKDEKYVAAIFDESHRLPGNSAHRLVLINHEFRISMTASPYREDGRERAIQRFAGTSIGGDWRPYRASGQIADVPVRVLVVNDLDEKFDALRSLVKNGRVLVFCEALADGRRVERELGIPFVYGNSKRKLDSVMDERVLAISKIGDCGLSLPEVNRVVELSFHGGARAQSLQRYGRLLHGRDGVEHTVLMTLRELSLYAKRLTALESHGCRIRIQLYTGTRGRRPETTPASLAKGSDNPWMRLLGMAA